ncbi:restriction endonuclease [Serratia fonticola]|uniref:restriction endonuclease n=1 Tax=Serratia fonticola TaxID=47917 RepID=UPI0004091C61|nr:restriction endonuclease [Serratia fonticola]
MTGLVHFEYAPPRSWEQFEELCADLFEAMWSDPNLVRHGRAGQVQDGVDIIAARGGISPVGLQCKKKSKWPEKEIKLSEITSEIEKAERFTPPLKEFYILTTASADAKLQKSIRELNVSRKQNGDFLVQVLFWGEIVRKIALYPMVAKKHFSVGANSNEFSPLLSTWYTSGGKLELADEEWSIAVRELFEDYYDWPTGHIIVRQRETDELINKINKMAVESIQKNIRIERLELRKKLRRMKERECYLQEVLHNVCGNGKLNFYIFDLNEDGEDAPVILRAIIENSLSSTDVSSRPSKIKIYPPTSELLTGRRASFSIALSYLPVNISDSEYREILSAESNFPKQHYGNEMCQVVSELPSFIRRKYVIPALISWLHRIIHEDKITLEELDAAGYLDINSWTYQH